MGYHVQSGGRWSKDYLILDSEKLNHADSLCNMDPIRCSELVILSYFEFPVATGKIRQPEASSQAQDQIDWEDDEPDAIQDDPSSSMGERQAEGSVDTDDTQEDFWSVSGEYLVRQHRQPPWDLYTPDDSRPFPIKWLDVHRRTETSLPDEAENRIEDY